MSDRPDLAGAAGLAGTLQVGFVNGGWAQPGSRQVSLLTGTVSVSNAGLTLAEPQSAIVAFTLLTPNPNEMALGYRIDYVPSGLDANQTRMAAYVNAIQQAGGTADFAPYAAQLLSMPDVAALGTAYDQLSPAPLVATATTAVRADLRFSDALHSCRVREGEFRFVSEGECSWVRLSDSKLDQDHTAGNLGFNSRTTTLAAGAQKHVGPNWSAGPGRWRFRSEIETVLP